MPVGIAQVRDPAPFVRDGRVFQPRARRHGPFDRAVRVVDHHVQMDRRPVPGIVARLPRSARGGCAGRFFQQIDGRFGAAHFGGLVPEPALQPQPEGSAIEIDGMFQIRHIDIDQDTHGSSSVGDGAKHSMAARSVVAPQVLKNLTSRP
ncbi:hypothetical protein D9M69_576550 [compost metagenome]